MSVLVLLILASLSRTPGLDAQTVAEARPTGDTLTLEAALDAAFRRDPRLAAAQAGVDAARAGGAQARAAWLPAVGASGALTRFQKPMVVAPLHGFDPRTPPEFDPTLAQGRFTVGWTVFDGGARGARIDAAAARSVGAEAGAAQAGMDATLGVLEAYLRVLGARASVVVQSARELDLEAEAARAERYFTEGAAPRLEVLRARAELEETRARGVGADAGLEAAEADLARVLGAPVEQVRSAALHEVRPRAAAGPGLSAPDDEHPALRAARARSAAAEALVGEARSAWLPRVQSTGGLVEYGSGSGDFTAEWQAGVQADFALFSGGARRARVDEARAEARRAQAEEAEVAEGLERASDQAGAGLREAVARAAALAVALERFEELTRVQALALEEGAGVQADYLRALSGLYGARLGLAEARRAVVLAAARLARVQGRLDRSWIATHLEEGP